MWYWLPYLEILRECVRFVCVYGVTTYFIMEKIETFMSRPFYWTIEWIYPIKRNVNYMALGLIKFYEKKNYKTLVLTIKPIM